MPPKLKPKPGPSKALISISSPQSWADIMATEDEKESKPTPESQENPSKLSQINKDEALVFIQSNPALVHIEPFKSV